MPFMRFGQRRWCGIGAILALVWAGLAHALVADKAFEHYVRNAWSLQEGLPQISVNAITQDGLGYLWVGTQTGLARFDGVRFSAYDPTNTAQLPGAWIRSLLSDADGAIWIGTYQGLARHDESGFQNIPASDPQRFPALDILALTRAADGSVLAATNEGAFRVQSGVLVPILQQPFATRAILARDDELWIGGIGKVIHLADDVTEMPLPEAANNAAVTSMVEVQGRIWLGTSRGLFYRAADHWRKIEVPAAMDAVPITALLADRAGNLWVASDAGLARIREERVVEWIGPSSPGYVKSIISLYEDREDNLWLGSQSQGLLRVWSGWTRRYTSSDGLDEPLVWSLSRAPDATLWVGTNNGVSTFRNGRFQAVIAGLALPNPQAYNLLAESDQVWIGTRRGIVLWRDGQVQTRAALAPLAEAQINSILREADSGDLLLATSIGLFREHAGELAQIMPDHGPSDAGVRYLLRTRSGDWLAGGLGGLWAVHGAHMIAMGLDSGLPERLDITAIHELPGGELFIGALGEKSYFFDGTQWHLLGPEQGLPGNVPFFITEDDHNTLWLAGIRGISRVPIADLQRLARGEIAQVAGEMIINERGDLRSGQQGFCCNGAGNSKGLMEQGTLWLPSRDGIVTLNPDEVIKNPTPPSVVIESVQVAQRWLNAQSPSLKRLPEAARDLQFAFAALSFQDPRSTLIQYRLQGYDHDWHTLGDGEPRRANYTNLPAGPYRFEVRAANNAGVWVAAPAQLAFRIPAHLTETGWFRAVALLLILAGLTLFLRWLEARHGRQQARLQRLVDQRTSELHALNLRLQEVSQTDPLTGLRNRRFLDLQIPADLGFYDRENHDLAGQKQVLLFALIDIDAFKEVNDRYGHHAGDRVLQQLAQLLTGLLRAGDYLVRWGGEEFLLVFRPMPSRLLSTIGERLRYEIANHVFELPDRSTLHITASIGMCEYPAFRDSEMCLDWVSVVELADRAMYWVKRHGRNGWATLRPTPSTRIAQVLMQVRKDMDGLLASGQLQMLSSSTPQGAEEGQS